MILPLVLNPDPRLRSASKPLTAESIKSAEVREFLNSLVESMHHYDGIGLAAAQLGKNWRICAVGKQAAPDHRDLILINPIWTKVSRRTAVDTEGCLSVPKTFGKVKRYKNIVVEAKDTKGRLIKFSADDLFARVIQHEVDHLDGILFIDKAKDIYTVDNI